MPSRPLALGEELKHRNGRRQRGAPTAPILPVARLVSELRARGVDRLVDGAHAPGMVPLGLSDLGAASAYYTGKAHQWLCAPKGAAFLHVHRDRQAQLHPNVINHGYTAGCHAEFDCTGTFDPTPWLCIPESMHSRVSALHRQCAARRLAGSDGDQSCADADRIGVDSGAVAGSRTMETPVCE